MHRIREVTTLPPPLQLSVYYNCVPCPVVVKAGNGNAAGVHSHAHAPVRG